MRDPAQIFIHSDQFDSVKKRFMSKVTMGPLSYLSKWRCWLWTAGTFNGRVGEFKLNSKRCSARRVSYELFRGRIRPSSSFVMNSCKNKLCVNPEHLYLKERSISSEERA